MTGPQFLTVKAAAKWLCIDVNTLRAWLAQRRIKHYRLGRKIVFKEEDLEAYVEQNRVDPIQVG